MTNPNIIGDEEGIKLWNLMANSTDPEEQGYFKRLSMAATKFGSVWFSDVIAQRNARRNQSFFSLKWEADKKQWKVALFHIPEGAEKEIANRDTEVIDEWNSVNPDNVINVEL